MKSEASISQALENYTKVIELRPEEASAYANRGNTYYRARTTLNSPLKTMPKLLNLEPSHGASYIGLGNVLDQQGDLESRYPILQ